MVRHVRTTPILRSFDQAKAREFYVDFLGFSVDWEHRFEPGLPLFMQVSRSGIVLCLSEHHGDGSPGVRVTIEVHDLRAFHAELAAKRYSHARPSLGPFIGGGIEMEVIDPAGNRLSFVERDAPASSPTLTAISPFFVVRDVVRSAAFYRDQVGFEVAVMIPEGNPFFAIVRRDGAQLLLKAVEATVAPRPNRERHPNARWDAFVHVSDPDALARELATRGLTTRTPPETTTTACAASS